MPELDIVRAWTGGCLWGSKRRYPDKTSFIEAVQKELEFGEDAPAHLSEAEITENRLRFCVGTGCGEDGEPHWHPEASHGAPVWQWGREY